MRPTVKLWEIATIQAWWTPNRSKKEYYEWWNIPRLKSWELNDSFSINENEEFITELWMENSSAKLFKKWTLLMAMYWATAWKLWILNIDATTNQAVCSIQNTKWLFDNLYVFYYLFLIRNKIIIDSFWWAQPNISKDYIKNIQIPLPPLETQKAIVAKLDQIFAELDQTKSEIQKNLDNTDEFWNSAWSKIFKEIWNIKILWEVCTMTQWIQIPLSDTITKFEPWYKRYIYISDLIDDDHIKYVKDIYPDKEVSESDLIMVNTWSTSWKIYWGKKWILSNNVFKIVGNENVIVQKYLYHYLKSYYFQSNLQRQLKHWAQPHLWHKIMSKQMIPVPPLSEQEKIVEHLDQVSKEVKELKSQYQSQLDNLEELKKSVLDKAFRWEMG